MNYKLIEKATQIGILLGILKILIVIFNLLFISTIYINQWYVKLFLPLVLISAFLIYRNDIFFRIINSNQKSLAIIIIFQVSSLMISVFDIYIHHTYDISFKNRIAEVEVQKLKSLDEKFEHENSASIINSDEFIQTEKNKIIKNYSIQSILYGFLFSTIGNCILMLIIKKIIEFFHKPFNISNTSSN